MRRRIGMRSIGTRRGLIGVALAAAVLVAGCAGGRQILSQEESPRDINWRRVATPRDRTRLRQWRQAWIAAIERVKADGAAAELVGEPQLFDPDRILTDARLPDGRYRCQVVKLGGRDPAVPAVARRGWTVCRVEMLANRRTLSVDGAQRLHGYLLDSDDTRQVFLGTLAFGDETQPMRYGRDAMRDAAGFVERIGKDRWRLVLPYPAFESTLDVVEIVPA